MAVHLRLPVRKRRRADLQRAQSSAWLAPCATLFVCRCRHTWRRTPCAATTTEHRFLTANTGNIETADPVMSLPTGNAAAALSTYHATATAA